MLSIRFFMSFFPPVCVGSACPSRLFLIFSVSEPEAQRGDDHRRGKADNAYQHIAACVLPQQHCAERAPCGGLSRPDDRARRLHQRCEQQYTHCGEAYCLAPLPSAGVFPHSLLDECDPYCGIVHIV